VNGFLAAATNRMADTHSQEAAAIISLAEVTRVQLPTAAGSVATVAGLARSHQAQLQQLWGELQEAAREQQQEVQQEAQQEAQVRDMSVPALLSWGCFACCVSWFKCMRACRHAV
jgi:molybdopterin synthase catalytic subunit